MVKTLRTTPAVNGIGSPAAKDNNLPSSVMSKRKCPDWMEQVQRQSCNMKATNKKRGLEKENEDSCGRPQLFSPPPRKKNSEVSAPKKKDKRLLQTLPLSSHMNNANHPMKYYHKTPTSSDPSSLTTTELLPCTPLLEFKSKKEYLATPRVLFDHCDKDITVAATVKMS